MCQYPTPLLSISTNIPSIGIPSKPLSPTPSEHSLKKFIMSIILCIEKTVPCLCKDFILGSINSEEKWVLSRDRAWDCSLTKGVSCWGSCHVEGHCLSVCLFDCRLVDLCLRCGLCYCFTSRVNIYGHVGTVS